MDASADDDDRIVDVATTARALQPLLLPLPPSSPEATSMAALSPVASAGETETIAVCIRVRPLNEREVRSRDVNVLRTLNAMKVIHITDTDGAPLSGKHNVFTYDHIFDETRSTRFMYKQVARRIVRSTLEGINGTIFAYGQTSSGKTFTMQGGHTIEQQQQQQQQQPPRQHDASAHGDRVGILQLALDDIFAYIERHPTRVFLLRVSFVEIYNEIVRDLLAPASAAANNLKIREDPRKGVFVDSREEIITSYADVLALLARGNSRRVVSSTAMNDQSSRSHSIFRIVIESKQKTDATTGDAIDSAVDVADDAGAVLVATLSLVDLAGSESVRHTAAEGIRQREAGNINRSLLTLSRVINSLASGASGGASSSTSSSSNSNHQNAPFRDSKLTRLLQTSLDGNTRTLIVCCVTPSDRFLDETKSTLQFAARAKTITTQASVNEVLDDQAQLRRLKREVDELKRLVDTNALSALKAENAALVSEQQQRKKEHARLVGLILTAGASGGRRTMYDSNCSSSGGSSNNKRRRWGANGSSNGPNKNKRTRETWCPGDFPASIRRSRSNSSSSSFQHLSASGGDDGDDDESKDDDDASSPLGYRLSKRRMHSSSNSNSSLNAVKENVRPALHQLPHPRLDSLDSGRDSVDSVERIATSRQDVHHAVSARLLGLLELALQRYRDNSARDSANDSDSDDCVLDEALAHVYELVERDDDRVRLQEFMDELQVLAVDAAHVTTLRSTTEVLNMEVCELHRRLEQQNGALVTTSTSASTRTKTEEDEEDEDDRQVTEALQCKLFDAQQQLEQQRVDAAAAADCHALEREALLNELDALRADAATAREAATVAQNERVAATATQSELEERIAALAADNATLTATLASFEAPHVATNSVGTNTIDASTANDSDALIAQLRQTIAQLEQDVAVATAATQTAEQAAERLQTALTYAANEKQAREVNIADVSAELAAATDQNAQLQRTLLGVTDDKRALLATVASIDVLERKLQEVLTERERHAAHVTALEQELTTLRAAQDDGNEDSDKATDDDGDDEETDSGDDGYATDDNKNKTNNSSKTNERETRREAHARVLLQVEELTAQLATRDAAARADAADAAAAAATLARDVAEYDATIADQVSAIEQLQAELALSDDDHAALQRRIDDLEQTLKQQTDAHASIVATLEAAAVVATTASSTTDVSTNTDADSSDHDAQQQQQLVELATEIERLTAELETVSIQRRDMFEELSAVESQLMIASREKLELTQANDALEKQLRDLRRASDASDASTNNELARTAQAETALLDELEQVTAIMDKLEAENKTLHEQLASAATTATAGAGATHAEGTDTDVDALQQRLELEAELRATLELDVKSYEETLHIVRRELQSSADGTAELLEKLRSMEVDMAALAAAKAAAERDCDVAKALATRATEEQHELRYQAQERARAFEASDATQRETITALEAQLRTAQQAAAAAASTRQSPSKQAADDAAAAAASANIQQLERTAADLEHELLAARKALAVADDAKRSSDDALEQALAAATRATTDAEKQLQDVDAAWRSRESEMRQRSTSELQTLETALQAAVAAKEALATQLDETETRWRAKELAMRQHADADLTSLRAQCRDAQDDLEAYTKSADDEIHALRATIDARDAELDDVTRAARAQEQALVLQLDEHVAIAAQLTNDKQTLEAKLAALLSSRDDAIDELTHELAAASDRCELLTSQLTDAVDSTKTTRAAMEQLEGEAYARRNELEDLAEALKSAQLEAAHYHDQSDAAASTTEALEALVATQRLRIDKLEKVKMTTETLELFHKLKRDRAELQHQVQTLEQQQRAAADARTNDKRSASTAARATVELETALRRECERHEALQVELQDVRDRTQREVTALEAAVRDQTAQIAALDAQVAAFEAEKTELTARAKKDISFLENENCELVIENRQLQKLLGSRVSRNSSSSSNALGITGGRSLLDDDTLDASAAAAAAILADTNGRSTRVAAAAAASRDQPPSSFLLLRPTTEASSGHKNDAAAAGAADDDASDDSEYTRPQCPQQ